ncbi:hypothetical protein BG006_010153 [Podila minutissima]|uniref:Uncharacterized protein n=1 Tax=Podila minutissima TaxID=64525 RepID=A0A9P5VIE2_9FUNG|nr:hypothetical protein BG006_010153 [Podila minutissima]
MLMQHCWNLISNNPGIERLDFEKHLKELKNLKIFRSSQILELLAAAPTIESLSIFSSWWQISDPLPEVNRTLRTLHMECLNGIRDLWGILDLFPNLSHLASIRSLDVNLDQDWDGALWQLPNLAEITTDDQLDKRLCLALIKNCHKLKAIRLRRVPMCIADSKESRPAHDPANRLLVSMSHIRVLDSLEALVDRIPGPGPMATELSAAEAMAVEKFERYRVQQRGVYDRLASLTRLKHSDLRFENRDTKNPPYHNYEVNGEYYRGFDGSTFDTLELSLASRLDRLGGLRHLEMIGFERIDHRIGRAEVEWTAKSWPNLRLMYGLDKERIHRAEPDPRRSELKAYLQ